jgi:hypothetical protein
VTAAARIALLLLPLASGCAWSLVADGRIREEPFAQIVTRTAAARGDPRPASVDARVVRKDDVPALLRSSVAHEWSPEEMARYQEQLVAIGLWPPERDLLEETLDVARDEVAGFYLTESGVLYVVEGLHVPLTLRFLSALLRRDLLRELVLSHEIVHLLQHRAVPELFQVSSWHDQDDAGEAVQAAIEGDATHYGFRAVVGLGDANLPAPAELQARMEEAAAEREGALAEAPALLRLTLAFPYARGYPLSREEGTALLDDPPASTEQVLHPERRRADFQVADLAGLETELPAGCESLGQNTLGELGSWVLFQDLGAAPRAAEASDGWDGDRYLAAHCGEHRAFLWWTAWDSVTDAIEFERAYADIAEAVRERAGLAATPRVSRDGAEVLVVSEPLDALAPLLAGRARRARIASLDGLRAHFGLH